MSCGMTVSLLAVFVLACRTATDFKCANNLCLPNTVECDGYDHCGDGSDEAEELCGAFVTIYTICIFFYIFLRTVFCVNCINVMQTLESGITLGCMITLSQKHHLFCDIFVRFHPILLIFSRNIPQEI